MRIICPHCQARAVITHRKLATPKLTELYTVCTNELCGARSVFRLYYSHDTTPPASVLTNALYEQVAALPREELEALIKTFTPKQLTLF